MSHEAEISQFNELCDAVFDDRATQEQIDQLEKLVLSSPKLKRKYAELAHQHAAMSWSGGEHPMTPSEFPIVTEHSSTNRHASRERWNSWSIAAITLASVLFTAIVTSLTLRDDPASTVAQLTQTQNCAWRDTVLPTAEGSRLLPGRMVLSEGLATIRFDHGVEVAVEAPAEFEILATDSMRLFSGRLIATAEPGADGFAVLTPTAELIDRGTVFGVSVADSGESNVIVFEGLVDAKSVETGKERQLKKGDRLKTSSEGTANYETGGRSTPDGTPGNRHIVQISTAVGRGQDTYVQRVAADDGHNSTSMVLIKNCIADWPNWDRDPKDWDRKAYLRFDLSLLENHDVESAELRLYFAPTGFGFASRVPDATFAVYGVTDELLDEWTEQELTWENAPANMSGSAEVDTGHAQLLGKFVVSQGRTGGTFGVRGEQLLELLQKDTNDLVTLVVVRETPCAKVEGVVHGFASRRHLELPPPTLRMTAGPSAKPFAASPAK